MNIKDILPPGTTFNVQNMNVFVMGKDETAPTAGSTPAEFSPMYYNPTTGEIIVVTT